MPRFDGTGPGGAGPMTGWGQGFCNPDLRSAYGPSQAWVPGYAAPGYGRGFEQGFVRSRGYGRGIGRGFGWFRGYGRGPCRRGFYPAWGRW